MKNLKIGAKIFLGFFCMLLLLSAIAATSVISSMRTGGNVDEVELYGGLQNSANDLMHIINETRITAEVLYKTQNEKAGGDISKQIMYCDYRLEKLYEYIYTHPGLDEFHGRFESFEELYSEWRAGIAVMRNDYNLAEDLSEAETESFATLAENMRRTSLLAHEILSNTISDIDEITENKISDTKSFNVTALWIVIAVSAFAFFAAIILSIVIMRSITRPMGYMRSILSGIGQFGDLSIPDDIRAKIDGVTDGRDETAQCMSALLTLVDRLHKVDETLAYVADGDLTASISLQSERDTMGLAVKRMLENLNQKFGTISRSTNWVYQEAADLSEGSRLLASGSQEQAESVNTLSEAVVRVSQKTERNTDLARQASNLIDDIQQNANAGTDKMNQMIQAAEDINTSSQAIGKVIKVINDIAFQTNILALNAAVEAARAGQHGKGFAVVADEVRNLATKSAEAAKDTGSLIEDTIKKAALGASIAEETSLSLGEIVTGVQQSNAIIGDISLLSGEQASDIRKIIEDVSHVRQIVEQNNSIATQSANSAGEISSQTNLLKEQVVQFKLAGETEGLSGLKNGGVR